MPRITKNPIVFLALSPAALATALGISTKQVADAILMGELVVFQRGVKRRILVSDAERWVRSWPRTTRKSRKDHP